MVGFDELKSIGKLLQEAGKIEQYNQILELQQQLMDMQKRIRDLEEENRDLKEKLSIKADLIYNDNAYWIKKEGDKRDGPFCTRCWDKNKDVIRLDISGGDGGLCPECENFFRFSKNDNAMGVPVDSW